MHDEEVMANLDKGMIEDSRKRYADRPEGEREALVERDMLKSIVDDARFILECVAYRGAGKHEAAERLARVNGRLLNLKYRTPAPGDV